MKLHHLVYYSRNAIVGDDRAHLQGLREIIKVSQLNNQRDGITGYLIFDKTWFLQILEGEQDTIFNTYRRIEKDPRHQAAHMMQSGPILQRQFPGWTMGGSMRTPEKQEIYLSHGIGSQIDPTRLKGAAVLNLALDLQAHELAQKAQQRLAG